MSKRARKLTRKQLRRRRQRRIQTGVILLSVFCIAGIGMMAFLNRLPAGSRYTYTTGSDIWYVEGGDVEVAGPNGVVTGERRVDSITAGPTPTAVPTATPTAVPTDTPKPTRDLSPVSITITATGDVTLGTYQTKDGISNFKSYVDRMGYDYFFQNYRELFEKDDLTIVNLEGPLTSHSVKRAGREFNFRGDPEYVNILTSGSVEICNIANNHALDYKHEGFEDTCKILAEAGIGASGFGLEYYTEVNGYLVGSLGFTEWDFAPADILETVQKAASKCDLLIVSMHWGEEKERRFSEYTKKMGMALVDAGADLVIGNHAHLYGSIMKYKGKYIINTLGNFCFGGNDTLGKRACAVFRQRFIMYPSGDVGDGGIDIVPGWISSNEEKNDFCPRIARAVDGKTMLQEILLDYSKGTLKLEDIRWMDDSYVYQNGILENPGQTVPDGILSQM